MSYASRRSASRRLGRTRRAVARKGFGGSGMSAGWWVAGISVGALVALAFAANAKDIARYIKISSM